MQLNTDDATHLPSPGRFMNRNFLLLWQGQFVSQLGNQAFLVAMMFWTMEATGSASLMGVMMMLSGLPMVALGPLGGTIADRHSRRTILITADLLLGLAVLVPALLLFWWSEATDWIVSSLLVVGLAGGLVNAVFQPAITAAIPDLVPRDRVGAANSLNHFSLQGSLLLGQAVGGILFRLLGAPVLFLIDALTFLFSALSESFIRIPQTLPEQTEGFRNAFRTYGRETLDGLRFVWKRPGMRIFLLACTGFNFLAMPVFILLPFYVNDHLGEGADWYGFLLAAMGTGALAGLPVAGKFMKVRSDIRSLAVLLSLIATGGLVSLLGWVQLPLAALVLFFLIGVLRAMFNIFVLTLFQNTTPSEMRGRVMALVIAISSAASPLGMAVGGIIADLTGRDVPFLYTWCGVMMTILIASVSTRRSLREFLGWETKD